MSQEFPFAEKALRLLSNGYQIVPILPGQKRPGVEDWQTLNATAAMVKRWSRDGFANGNVGVITAHTPAVDLDIYDEELAEYMEAWCLRELGDAPVRIGRAPKRLLVFRANQPFKKLSAEFYDSRNQKHKIEILGDGQQFVAYGIHPETKQPFRWTSLDQPLDTTADALPVLTQENALRVLEEFKHQCELRNWRATSRSLARPDSEDALLNLKQPLNITEDKIREALEYLSPDDGYDAWCSVGMALHHQFDGGDDGLALWDEWSQKSHHYDADEIINKWPTFSERPDGRMPVTVASILKTAKETQRKEASAEFERVLNVIRTATNKDDLFGSIAKQVSLAITQEFEFDIACKKIQERVEELTEVRPRIDVVRKAVKSARGKSGSVEGARPSWLNGWVYLQNGDRFYNVNTKTELTERGFNALHDREVLTSEDRTMGVAMPGNRASTLALNLYEIPMVYSTIYLPGFARVIEFNGKLRANTYDENSQPPSKIPETPEELLAIQRVENHFKMLFPDERECALVLDYLAYNVQFPAEKIIWALLIQGAEGVGKTWIATLLKALLGPENVSPLSAAALQDQFTGWAEGSKLLFIEEIRLHGTNRYELLEKMKEYVTNEDVTIRRMARDRYTIPNVTNYVLYTNYWDALPLKKTNRRYLVLGTSIQTEEDQQAFAEKYPDHYSQLYDAVTHHAPVLRNWFLTRRLSAWFEPKRPAPDTYARHRMSDISGMSSDSDALESILADSTDPQVCALLLSASALKDAAENMGHLMPEGRALATLLSHAGFHLVGRFTLTAGAPMTRFYTRKPALFKRGEELEKIREILSIPTEKDLDPFA